MNETEMLYANRHAGRKRLRSWDRELLRDQEPARAVVMCSNHPCMTLIDTHTGRTVCRFCARGKA